jgi:hypothetical protein
VDPPGVDAILHLGEKELLPGRAGRCADAVDVRIVRSDQKDLDVWNCRQNFRKRPHEDVKPALRFKAPVDERDHRCRSVENPSACQRELRGRILVDVLRIHAFMDQRHAGAKQRRKQARLERRRTDDPVGVDIGECQGCILRLNPETAGDVKGVKLGVEA